MSSLEIKVLAVNTLNEYAKKIIAHEVAGFKKLIGVDAYKADGSLKAKYHFDKLESVSQKLSDNWLSVEYFRDRSEYSVAISIKVCINGGSYEVTPATAFCHYENQTFYVARIENGKIESKELDLSMLDEKFTAAKLLKLNKEVENAAAAYDKAKSAIDHRFREVLHVGYIH